MTPYATYDTVAAALGTFPPAPTPDHTQDTGGGEEK